MTTPLHRAAVVCLLLALTLSGCAGLLGSAQTPGPEAFPGIAGFLGRYGVDVSSWTAGDDGCDDPTLSATAIRFDATGLDETALQHLRIYIFRNRDAWERRLADVDTCVAAWAEDPATFQIVQVSPYVVAGQGPWPPEFSAALRKGLTEAAGTGD
ncbi:MAG: hypothetical protein ABI620_01670 [Chloroflexota bacterium]